MKAGEETSYRTAQKRTILLLLLGATVVSTDKQELDGSVVVKIVVEFTQIMNLVLITVCLPIPKSADSPSLCQHDSKVY